MNYNRKSRQNSDLLIASVAEKELVHPGVTTAFVLQSTDSGGAALTTWSLSVS